MSVFCMLALRALGSWRAFALTLRESTRDRLDRRIHPGRDRVDVLAKIFRNPLAVRIAHQMLDDAVHRSVKARCLIPEPCERLDDAHGRPAQNAVFAAMRLKSSL